MFTGIVQRVATLVERTMDGASGRIRLAVQPWDQELELGESVAVEGVCLTVTAFAQVEERLHIDFDVLGETFRLTSLGQKNVDGFLNLERSLRFGDLMGGHVVSGHVDGVGTIAGLEQRDRDWVLTIACGPELLDGIVYKGSIACNGISLTVASVTPEGFSIHLIPHTWTATSCQSMQIGDRVNLEIDMIGKYVKRYAVDGKPVPPLSWDGLSEPG